MFLTINAEHKNSHLHGTTTEVELPGARHPVTARGNERRSIFRDDPDRRYFLGLLDEWPDRLVAGAVLGTAEFVDGVKSLTRGISKEVSRAGCRTERMSWARIAAVVEAEHGGRCAEFRDVAQ